MLKRIISILVSALLICSVFAGCGGSSGGKQTVKWMVLYANQKDTKTVEKAINKKLEKLLPGVQIELVEFVKDNWTRWMASNEQIDLAWTGYQLDMETETTMGSYMPLDELVEKYAPNVKREMKDYAEDYDTGRLNGKLYAIPNQQPLISETNYITIPAETVKYFDVDGFLAETKNSPYTTRKIYDIIDKYLDALKTNDALDTDFVGKYCDSGNLLLYLALRGIQSLVNGRLGYRIFDENGKIDENPEVVKMDEQPEFKLFTEYAKKWYDKGYINKDGSASGGQQIATISANHGGMWNDFTDENDNGDKGMRAVYDTSGNLKAYNINIEPRDYSHSYSEGAVYGSEATYLAIPKTAKYPEAAMKLINLMRDPIGEPGNDILNMAIYGFEKDSEEAKEYGVWHYTLNGDQIHSEQYIQQADAGSDYGQPHWSVGNVFLCYRTENIKDGQKEYAINYDNNIRTKFQSIASSGFVYSNKNVQTELSSINSVVSEFYGRFGKGNYESDTYKKYINKLNAAGLDKVKTDLLKQLKEQGKNFR